MYKRIVIIGAGASGFAAASKLISHGFKNVLILEAENRIGGRIHTIPFGANVLDMGAQWCHGEKGNVVYELAKDKNILSSNPPRYADFNFVRSNGETVPEEIAAKLTSITWNIIENSDEEMRQYNGSLGNFFSEKYYAMLQGDDFKNIDPNIQREVLEFVHQYINMYVASDSWYRISCKNYPEYQYCPGDMLLNWKDRGYCLLFDLLQNKIPVGRSNVIDVQSKVQLNKEVTKIKYNTGSDILVRCADGSEYPCDHLICTASLGVLKKNQLCWFDPPLPRQKFDCIESQGFGTMDKIYLEFTKPFWSENWEGMSCLWTLDQLKEVNEDRVNGEWMKSILGLYPVSFQPNILCAWVSGEAANKMEKVSESDLKKGVERVLNMFVTNCNGANLKNVIRSQWHSNPHFLGSYSFYSVESDAIGVTIAKLAAPILDQNAKPLIQFAGEATDSHYYSTVHGAVGSGWREAQRLIDLYTCPKSKL